MFTCELYITGIFLKEHRNRNIEIEHRTSKCIYVALLARIDISSLELIVYNDVIWSFIYGIFSDFLVLLSSVILFLISWIEQSSLVRSFARLFITSSSSFTRALSASKNLSAASLSFFQRIGSFFFPAGPISWYSRLIFLNFWIQVCVSSSLILWALGK